MYRAIEWITAADGKPAVRMMDQRLVPEQSTTVDCTDYQQIAAAIETMVIRGAPAIGLAAAYGLALTAARGPQDIASLRDTLHQAAARLRTARPTAVNLAWALDRMLRRLNDPALQTVEAVQAAAAAEAQAIDAENLQMELDIARHAFPLIPDPAYIYHHCNTGPLATGGYGTALGAIRYAHEQGKRVHVFVDETRPRLQGARLTTWELQQMGIPFTLLPDGASGYIMRTRRVDLCLVGCDRVAANGDVANKIGTYNLALAAHAHHVPFYVVGPSSSVDLQTPNGDAIPIEMRPAEEVTHIGGVRITPEGCPVANPAFDVTPAALLTGIVTERGVAYPPLGESLARLLRP